MATRRDLFEFAIVRNPFVRAASAYLDKHVRGGSSRVGPTGTMYAESTPFLPDTGQGPWPPPGFHPPSLPYLACPCAHPQFGIRLSVFRAGVLQREQAFSNGSRRSLAATPVQTLKGEWPTSPPT